MSDRVSLSLIAILALCVISAVVMQVMGQTNHDAYEIIKLITAGVTGALTGKSADDLLDRGGRNRRATHDDECPECGTVYQTTRDQEIEP